MPNYKIRQKKPKAIQFSTIKFIGDKFHQGWSQHRCRQEINPHTKKKISHDTIKRVYEALTNDPTTDLTKLVHSIGRPVLDNPQLLNTIDVYFCEDELPTLEGCQQKLIGELGNAPCRTTLATILRFLGFSYRPPKRTPKLTEAHKKARRKFARTLLEKFPQFLDKLVFSDESRFCLDSDKGFVWVKRGQDTRAGCVQLDKHPVGVMMFAAISFNWKSNLVQCIGNVDADAYKQNIEACGILGRPAGSYIFMQDGAPAHTAKSSVRWLQQRMNLLLKWPANSPDLNPIEMLWAHMKRKLRADIAQYNLTTAEDLANALQRIWEEIPIEHINGLVSSFKSRLQFVIHAQGECINNILRKSPDERDRILAEIEAFAPLADDEDGFYTENQIMAAHDPTLPNHLENEGKEFLPKELGYLFTRISKWQKLKTPPYGQWARVLKRTKTEVFAKCAALTQAAIRNTLPRDFDRRPVTARQAAEERRLLFDNEDRVAFDPGHVQLLRQDIHPLQHPASVEDIALINPQAIFEEVHADVLNDELLAQGDLEEDLEDLLLLSDDDEVEDEEPADEEAVIEYGNPPEYAPAPAFIPNETTPIGMNNGRIPASMPPLEVSSYMQSLVERFEDPRVRSSAVAAARQMRPPSSYNDCQVSSSMAFMAVPVMGFAPPPIRFVPERS